MCMSKNLAINFDNATRGAEKAIAYLSHGILLVVFDIGFRIYLVRGVSRVAGKRVSGFDSNTSGKIFFKTAIFHI
jgi:hypothetical protein